MERYVYGCPELQAKLKTLKDKVVKSALRKGTRAGTKLIAAQAKQLVPVRTGALRRAIKVRALPRSKKWVGTQIKLELYYASFVEMGTTRQAAQHFLQQAAKQERQVAADATLAIVKQEVEKV